MPSPGDQLVAQVGGPASTLQLPSVDSPIPLARSGGSSAVVDVGRRVPSAGGGYRARTSASASASASARAQLWRFLLRRRSVERRAVAVRRVPSGACKVDPGGRGVRSERATAAHVVMASVCCTSPAARRTGKTRIERRRAGELSVRRIDCESPRNACSAYIWRSGRGALDMPKSIQRPGTVRSCAAPTLRLRGACTAACWWVPGGAARRARWTCRNGFRRRPETVAGRRGLAQMWRAACDECAVRNSVEGDCRVPSVERIDASQRRASDERARRAVRAGEGHSVKGRDHSVLYLPKHALSLVFIAGSHRQCRIWQRS
ncbi:hypothetical protein CERSUDRAFT_111860, partial [Gelatoporia subvermispora B]